MMNGEKKKRIGKKLINMLTLFENLVLSFLFLYKLEKFSFGGFGLGPNFWMGSSERNTNMTCLKMVMVVFFKGNQKG